MVEPVLAHALAGKDADAARACVDFLRLHADPDYTLYQPRDFVRAVEEPLSERGHSCWCDADPEELVGDPAAMRLCLLALTGAIELDPDSSLAFELVEIAERRDRIPLLAMSFDGPGRIPPMLTFFKYFWLTLEETGDLWTLASSGGRIDNTDNGLALRLKGMRMTPQTSETTSELLAVLGATPGPGDLKHALAIVDGEEPPEPRNLGLLLKEAATEFEESLRRASVHIEFDVDENLPPLLLRRERARRFFASLFQGTLWMAPENASLTVVTEYDRGARDAGILATLTPHTGRLSPTFHGASMRRAIEDNGGSFDMAFDESECMISAALPDQAGKALDAWIPGWEAFSEKSQQMLRLLKGGGQAPPEDVILPGVLEEELGRLLLERLATPLARNVAREIKPYHQKLEGSEPGRLEKALEQIGRGKPKNELAQPKYAGEILWAFREDERQRHAAGSLALTGEELRQLCETLLNKAPDCILALRLLGKAVSGNTPARG